MGIFSAFRPLLRRWWADACAPHPFREDEWASPRQLDSQPHALGTVLEAVRQHRAHERVRHGCGLVASDAGWAVPAPGPPAP